MEEEYKVKELKRPKCQTLMTDLLRSCGGWQITRKGQESRMASRTLGVISDSANYWDREQRRTGGLEEERAGFILCLFLLCLDGEENFIASWSCPLKIHFFGPITLFSCLGSSKFYFWPVFRTILFRQVAGVSLSRRSFWRNHSSAFEKIPPA